MSFVCQYKLDSFSYLMKSKNTSNCIFTFGSNYRIVESYSYPQDAIP